MGRGPVSAGRVSPVISGHAACATVSRTHVRWLGEPPPRRSDRVSPGGESGPPGAPGPSAASPDRCPTPTITVRALGGVGMRLVTDWPPRIAAPSWSGWADRTVTGRGYSRPLLGHGHPVSWLPYELPAGDDRQVSSQDRRSVKLRVRPPPAGTHQCHRATSAGSGMMLTVKLRRWCTDPAPSVRHDRPPGHRSDGR